MMAMSTKNGLPENHLTPEPGNDNVANTFKKCRVSRDDRVTREAVPFSVVSVSGIVARSVDQI